MAQLLNGTPSGTQGSTAAGQDEEHLDPGESYCSPQLEAMLHKVMALVFHSLNDPKKLAFFEAQLHKAPNPGAAIGNMTFVLLMTIFDGARHAGQQLPPEVFLAQGGAVYQTIDRLMMIAEHAGIHLDPDKTREDAMGACLDRIREHWAEIKQPGSNSQRMHMMAGGQPPSVGPGHPLDGAAMPANPMAHAVSQGLQQQGLMSSQGGMTNA